MSGSTCVISARVIVHLTVVAMEVLIKYCINSFLKLTNSFDRKLSASFKIAQLPY